MELWSCGVVEVGVVVLVVVVLVVLVVLWLVVYQVLCCCCCCCRSLPVNCWSVGLLVGFLVHSCFRACVRSFVFVLSVGLLVRCVVVVVVVVVVTDCLSAVVLVSRVGLKVCSLVGSVVQRLPSFSRRVVSGLSGGRVCNLLDRPSALNKRTASLRVCGAARLTQHVQKGMQCIIERQLAKCASSRLAPWSAVEQKYCARQKTSFYIRVAFDRLV